MYYRIIFSPSLLINFEEEEEEEIRNTIFYLLLKKKRIHNRVKKNEANVCIVLAFYSYLIQVARHTFFVLSHLNEIILWLLFHFLS